MLTISRASEANSSHEYGCDLRRLYPWAGVADTFWGSALASIAPGQGTAEHFHDEEETFIILKGAGTIVVGNESSKVVAGDVIYLPRNVSHRLENVSDCDPLEFITIFWGSPEADERMYALLAERRKQGSAEDARAEARARAGV